MDMNVASYEADKKSW